ncbi:hypothetical protein [Actinokineospora bangkokensis]|uniref:Uncharacterized protein n=1 Tax=Actinokineospora bangkokensis TaxID=1193682 RepID=A0A1Q9LIV6_9PSEU|nr:hypothetical protein [Actinokineospora bangkokensis]OLR91924.1 hypothetical protein BJP25_24150 [Actinokineospora bangkokensis]
MSTATREAVGAAPRRSTEGWHRPLLVLAAAMAVAAVLTFAGVLLDPRVLVGEPVWVKPFKFALSIGTFAITWSWLRAVLTAGRRTADVIGWFLVLLLSVEYLGLVVQAFRGRRSHFNKQSAFDTVLGNVMGISAALIMVSSLVLAVLFLFARSRDRAAVWAIRAGALLSVVGMGFGPLMGAETEVQRAARLAGHGEGIFGGHSVGVPDGGPSMPLTGWSTVGGDLRIPHLVGIHALQVIPLVLVLVDLLARRWAALSPQAVRIGLVAVVSVSYAGLLATVAWQALRGQSLVHPDTATLTALGAVAGFALIGSAAVVGVGALRGKYRKPIAA